MMSTLTLGPRDSFKHGSILKYKNAASAHCETEHGRNGVLIQC